MRAQPRRTSSIIFLWLLAAALTVNVPGCGKRITDDDVRRMDVGEVAQLAQSERERHALLLDARPPAEYEAGSLPGAVNVRLEDVGEGRRHPALERYRTLVVFGQDRGSASSMALAKRLVTQGYSDVRLFEGGVQEWVSRGYPLERGLESRIEPIGERRR